MQNEFPNTDEARVTFIVRAKASMREFLRSKTWEEKVESIERMNAAGKMAREVMRQVHARQNDADTEVAK